MTERYSFSLTTFRFHLFTSLYTRYLFFTLLTFQFVVSEFDIAQRTNLVSDKSGFYDYD